MIVPGSNLLTLAQGLIGQQKVMWSRFLGQTTNAAGVKVPTWAAPVAMLGSFQPVSRSLLQTLGLDFNKNYANFYASANILDVIRNATGDRLVYAGRTYQVLSNTDWFAQDGWKGVMCIEVTNVSPAVAASLAFNHSSNSMYVGQVI